VVETFRQNYFPIERVEYPTSAVSLYNLPMPSHTGLYHYCIFRISDYCCM